MSYKQAQQRGWQVRRGEIGTQIEYWEFPSASREREQRGSQPDSDQGDKTAPRMIHRIYTVFNAKQIDGIPPYTPKQRAELASLFLAAERAIPHNPASHAAYVGSWLQALRPVCKLSRTSNSYSLDSAPPHLRHRRRRGCWHRLLGVGWQARERDKDRHHVWRRLCRHRHTAAEALDQVNGSTKCIAA